MTTILALAFTSATTAFNLPQGLLESVCYVESKYDVNAVHIDDGGSNSVGVCQLHITTARWMGFDGPDEKLLDPQVNAYYAAAYLHYQLNRYHNNVVRALIAYNRGNALNLEETTYSNKVIAEWRKRGKS